MALELNSTVNATIAGITLEVTPFKNNGDEVDYWVVSEKENIRVMFTYDFDDSCFTPRLPSAIDETLADNICTWLTENVN